MASLEHTISRTLECPLCLDLLNDPKQLSCTHTFCKTCLSSLLACSWKSEAANTLACPICRSITDVKDGDVMSLNTNVHLKPLIDDLRTSQQLCEMCQTNSQAVHFCQDCSKNMCDECLANHNKWPPHLTHEVVLLKDTNDGDVMSLDTNVPLKPLIDDLRNSQQLCEMCHTNSQAVHFCQDCSKNMCDECLGNHNKWPPHLTHEVVLLKDIQERKVALKKKVFCQEHDERDGQQNVCTDVCLTCKKFICMRCRMVFHEKKNHTVEDAEEYKVSTTKQIQILQTQGLAKAESTKIHLTFIDKQMERVTDHVDHIYDEISDVYLESIKKLNESKATLVGMVDAQKGSLCQRLQNMKDDHEKQVASLESTSLMLSNNLKAPLGGDVIAIRHSLSDKLQSLIDHDAPDVQLVTDVADRAEELFFKPDKQDPLGIGEFYVRYEMIRGVKLSGGMNSLAPTLDGRMAVGYSGGGIDFVSENGQVQQTVLKDVGIRVARFLSDGGYVVLDLSNNITIYTPKCVKSEHERFMTLDPEEGGLGSLAVGSFDLIYVGYCKPMKIQEFHPGGGNAIREIKCNGFEPRQITCHNDSFIVNYDTSTRIVGRNGVVKHRVKKSNLISYATVTQDNSILIAWVKHDQGLVSIEKFSNKLKPIKTLISDHMIEKSEVNWYCLQVFQSGGIAFCTPNRLYIWACPQ